MAWIAFTERKRLHPALGFYSLYHGTGRRMQNNLALLFYHRCSRSDTRNELLQLQTNLVVELVCSVLIIGQLPTMSNGRRVLYGVYTTEKTAAVSVIVRGIY